MVQKDNGKIWPWCNEVEHEQGEELKCYSCNTIFSADDIDSCQDYRGRDFCTSICFEDFKRDHYDDRD